MSESVLGMWKESEGEEEVCKRGIEEERGWANEGNKERMRFMADTSWHSAIHSVVEPGQTCVHTLWSMVRCS